MIILLVIMLLGAGLRLWQLGSVPPSPNWDEVALAYDAHSLFHTGRDEFGNFMPAVLRSFDDYKPAVYAYLAIPAVEVFGLTSFAIRLPSAVMGIVAILAIYFLVKELFSFWEKKKKNSYIAAEPYALLSAFLLAIAPWHVQFSQIAFESNVALTFNLLAALFFIKGLNKPWMLLLSAFFAGANLSVYQSARVFTPLLVLSLIIIFRKQLFSLPKKYIVTSVIIGLLTILPMFTYFVTNENALVRVRATSIFSNQTQILERIAVRLLRDKEQNDYVGMVLDNRRIAYVNTIAGGYLYHFDPNWLFIKGDINRHHSPRMGLLYLILLPFLLIGVYKLLFSDFPRKAKYVIFSWLLIAPIPASITFEVPHAVRTLNLLPPLLILSAIGLISSTVFLRNYRIRHIKNVKYIFYIFFAALAVGNFLYFINQYYVQQNYFYAQDWQYGYKQAVAEIQKEENKYKKIVVSDRQPLDKSYMFFLFYLKYPPQEYQKIGATSSGSFEFTHYFGKYVFRPFKWEEEKNNRNVLYVGSPKDFPGQVKSKKIIHYPDGTKAILIVDPKNNL